MTPKLVICTPLYGHPESASVSLAYMLAREKILRRPDISIIGEHNLFMNCDLVRARSRAVHMFLESSASHLLFWDSDVIPRDLRCIDAMVASGKDVISLPYPRKAVDFEALSLAVRNEQEQSERGRQDAFDLECGATSWPMMWDGWPDIGPDATAPVEYAPAGFMMLSRSCCELLVEACRKDLSFRDVGGRGAQVRMVAVFQLMIRNELLLSEDFSFCQRWRDLGDKCWVLADPADHVGAHRYRGHQRALIAGHI